MRAKPRFVPGADLTREEMLDMQAMVAKAARFEDGLDLPHGSPTTSAVDQAFPSPETVCGAAIAWLDGKIVEEVTALADTPIPYIPGLLAFRELPAIVASLERLTSEIDLVLVDGNGRLHPRQAGLATHVGVAFDSPTVGVAKSLLCGTPRESIEELDEGERVAIVAKEDEDGPEGTVLGYAVQTRQFEGSNRYVNPVFVSPGHRVSPETAVHLVDQFTAGYKLPEPIRAADRLAASGCKADEDNAASPG